MIPGPRLPVTPWQLEPPCVRLKLDHPEARLDAAPGMPHVFVPLPHGWVEVFAPTWDKVLGKLRNRAPELFRRRGDGPP